MEKRALFFLKKRELGNDIKMAVNRIEYSRVENDINKVLYLNSFVSAPPIIKIPISLFSAFFFSSLHISLSPEGAHCW